MIAVDKAELCLQDFEDDKPWSDTGSAHHAYTIHGQIDGVVLRRLVSHADSRGDLTVLFSPRYVADADPSPHVYLVTAAAGSVRAWVYHRHQHDRLAFLRGHFEVVLFDLRPASPTHGIVNVLHLGADNPTQLTIPPLVVHGVRNVGPEAEIFVNMPTRAYDPSRPDKARLPENDPRVPFHFD